MFHCMHMIATGNENDHRCIYTMDAAMMVEYDDNMIGPPKPARLSDSEHHFLRLADCSSNNHSIGMVKLPILCH